MAALTKKGTAGADLASGFPGKLPPSAQEEFSPEELRERVAILRRFRELLLGQRDRFQAYLEVLDKQKDVIERRDTEALISHIELEEKIVADIFSIQKVITPLENMYRAVFPAKPGSSPESAEVPGIKSALESLKNEAVIRSERNKKLLLNQMSELRSEIKALRENPFARRSSIYAESGTASLIDIQG
ncbi:MAG: flagellar biosynthesis protein FlgN [Treponema sp.]|jgi:hypothetical protein|nr:flagellar biosynthesis protein FlgN [Treponema sp.]